MELQYNWFPALVTVGSIIALTVVLRLILFSIPALAKTRAEDKAKNKEKFKKHEDRYRRRVPLSQKIGLSFNLFFFLAILPFIVTFDAQPVWKILLLCVVVLMVYDFFYYLMHRFLFHGSGYFLRVHGVHHQARSRVSSVDSFLLHPTEIFMGIALFYLTTVSIVLLTGEPFHAATIVICSVIYTQLNQMNHARIDLDTFPWRTVNWIALRHDAHHLGMTRGNYATITLFYDWLFGTLERHPLEDQQAGVPSNK